MSGVVKNVFWCISLPPKSSLWSVTSRLGTGKSINCFYSVAEPECTLYIVNVQRPNSLKGSRQKSEKFYSLLLLHSNLYSFAWDFYFFKITQPLTVSVKEKGGNLDRKPYPPPYGIRNPDRNLKSVNYQDYAQIPQRDFAFMNSASVFQPFLYPFTLSSPMYEVTAGRRLPI